MKTLKFAPHLVKLVLFGEKTSTWRLFDDKDLQKEDELILINKETGEEFARATILNTREKKLKDLKENDFEGHEKFESEEKMYEAYKSYYGNRVTPDTIVKIISFKMHNVKNYKEILYATTNDAKLKIMQSVLGDEYKIINLNDVGIKFQIEEDGISPAENALKKARYCYEKTNKPSFSMDFGFFIDGLPKDRQPGPSVKRIIPVSKEKEPNDEEVLEFYKNIITSLGGKVDAYWLRALAYVSKDGEFTEDMKIQKVLTDIPSNIRRKGFPMTSIQIDTLTGKYECELTDEERTKSHKVEDEAIRSFVHRYTK